MDSKFCENDITDCKTVQFNTIDIEKGKLSIIENNKELIVDIKRVYYLYDVPSGEYRGGHAHKELQQIIIAANGSFSLKLSDGSKSKSVLLNKPNEGLVIVPGIWRELSDFSGGAVCLVLASEVYSEEDYIRDYQEFKSKKINS
jgi:hypothetical protein